MLCGNGGNFYFVGSGELLVAVVIVVSVNVAMISTALLDSRNGMAAIFMGSEEGVAAMVVGFVEVMVFTMVVGFVEVIVVVAVVIVGFVDVVVVTFVVVIGFSVVMIVALDMVA